MGKCTTQHLSDAIYRTLKKREEGTNEEEIVILESQLPQHPESSRTYIAAYPKKKFIVKGSTSTWFEHGKIREFKSDPWSLFKRFRQEAGWLFGYIGYDIKHQAEVLNSSNRVMYDAPDLYMMEPSILFKVEDENIEQIVGEPVEIKPGASSDESCYLNDIKQEITFDEYIQKVKHIKDLITEGEFYELNFSYPITAEFEGSSFELYKKMRDVNPVPFGSYIELEDLRICCSSPERFLRNRQGQLISEPIKGTSGRSTDPATDNLLRNTLKNPKNEAENLMIVDLVRHDLSQVSRPGSIRVSKLYDIQTFGTVHQLISRVEGEMEQGVDPVDAIKACFPMGSMTGAPKLRVMEQIEELEFYKRGIYSGSIGYFTPEGDFDLNVVIRTAIIQGNSLTYPVGGAITGDSDPEEEWDETLVKAKNLTSVAKK